MVFDGVVVYSGTGSYQSQYSNPIGLFGRIGYDAGSSARIFSFSVTDATTGQKIQDLIPVRKNGVGYMYDRVSGQLLGNSGTGDFVLGPDKPYDYEVAYIERNFTTDWIENGSAVAGGFDMARYMNGATYSTLQETRLNWSFTSVSDAHFCGLYLYANVFVNMHLCKPSSYTVYQFGPAANRTDVSGGEDSFHTQVMIPQEGGYRMEIDGVFYKDYSTTNTSVFNNMVLMRTGGAPSAVYSYNGACRVKSFRYGSSVYLIPVVKGNAVGFCNLTDGHMFLE